MPIIDVLIGFLTNIHFIFYIISFFVGGIPFGLMLAKKFANVNLQETGSQSIGATNVLRVVKEKNPALAKKLAAITIALDAFKGVFMLIIGTLMGFDVNALWMMALMSVTGHCFSPYLKFEGGKGVATGAGVMLFLLPIETLISLVVWFIAGRIFKISSVASLLAVAALIISVILIHGTIPHVNSFTPLVIIAFIIVYKHIPNIIRLFKKEESKVV
ncbi:MAG: glycerol-3-phosphate 1-O-acyltransferase PlsY [Campylobacteraceae bacterium]|jgi:glycerol-3-phosphate acyltransferase PlsY|nr:glycerol-3-phosphate 1-O-acyltransferase PlsY [Campylobacteraceae bacterium]